VKKEKKLVNNRRIWKGRKKLNVDLEVKRGTAKKESRRKEKESRRKEKMTRLKSGHPPCSYCLGGAPTQPSV
jgi:hypothetical protein